MTEQVTRAVCSIKKLKPSTYNPRTITPEARAGLAASIDRFGFVQEIVVNKRNMHVIGGHQRLSVLMEKGLSEVPVAYVNLDPTEEKALNITLNNPHVAGEFTPELQELLADLQSSIPERFMELRLNELLSSLNKTSGLAGDSSGSGSELIYESGTKVSCPHCKKAFKLP